MPNTLVETRTSDPTTPLLGQIWLRTDLLPNYIPAPSLVAVNQGSEQNTVSWSSVTGATSYDIKWGTTQGVHDQTISGVVSPYIHSGLTNLTTYYYVVVSHKDNITSADSVEASGTPGTSFVPFNYDFETEVNLATDNNLRWQQGNGGTITQITTQPGTVEIISSNTVTTKASFLYYTASPNLTDARTYTVKAHSSGTANENEILTGDWFSGLPAPLSAANMSRAFQITTTYISASQSYIYLWYWDASKVQHSWTGTAWATGSARSSKTITTDTKSIFNAFQVVLNGSTIVIKVLAADGVTVVDQTDPISVSSLYAPGGKSLYLLLGDYATDAWKNDIVFDSVGVA